MSLNSLELRLVVAELDPGLRGAILQNLFCPTSVVCYLKLRQVGHSTLLRVSAQPGAIGVSVASKRGGREDNPPALQFALRKGLLGAQLRKIQLLENRLIFQFERAESQRQLIVTLQPLLARARERVESFRLVDLEQPSHSYPHPEETAQLETPAQRVSRLEPVVGARFPLASAAERLLSQEGDLQHTAELRGQQTRKLSQQLARLERTILKVREEASRGEKALMHRHFGELLAQNSQAIPRGATSVELPDYSTSSVSRVVVPLDPKRRPQDQATWHFHQYRRLQRGSEIASRRLTDLEKQRVELSQRLEETLRAPMSQLTALVEENRAHSERPRVGKSVPYREYQSRRGDRIWVGKGGNKNEELTFRIARPHDLWLHARGVAGAHVVVPLNSRESEISSEVLVDAAHLALFHSKAKGEPRGEVSYTRVRNLRRQKSEVPGQVTYSQEKTIMIRVEAERLARLLQSVSQFETE